MQKFALTIATATALLVAGTCGWQAQAQSLHPGATKIPTAAATLVPTKDVACRGWGRYCRPGFVRACGPHRCWCRPCH
jgi:hypothetical protein